MPKKFISNQVLREVLEQATPYEKLSLTKLIEPKQKKSFGAIKLQTEICEMGGHGIVNIFRGQGTGYLDIVDDVADELKIKGLPSYNLRVKYFEEIDNLKFNKKIAIQKGIDYAEKAEEKIILKLLKLVYDKLDETKKEEFDKQINKVAKQFDSSLTASLTGTAGLVVLGNLGGFATYTFLTTSLSTISMGTLGFGAYTAATSFLSIALGPAGWAALGVAGVFALGKPEYEKLIPIVAMIGAIRQRITYDKSTKRVENQPEDKDQKDQKDQKKDIFYYIENNDFKNIEQLIENNDNLNHQNNDGDTALLLAYKQILSGDKHTNEYLEVVQSLLAKCVDTNLKNSDNNTALLLALRLPYNNKNLEIIKILIENSDDLNHQNNDGLTALMQAVDNNYTEVIKILLNKKAKLNVCTKDKNKKKIRTALMLACEKDNTEVVSLLSKEIFTINYKNDYNQTALHIAILNSNLNSIKVLIENKNKPDINIESKDGFTPFMLACYQGDMKIVQYLYKFIDDINTTNTNGFTALAWACFGGEFSNWKLDIVKFLIENDAKVDMQDKDKFTPLMWASIRGNMKVVEFLISKSANIDAQNIDGYTALIWASLRGHYDIVKFLIKHSGKPDIKSKSGKNALDFAKEKEHKNIIEFFEPSEKKKTISTTNTIDTFSFNNFKAFGNHPQTFTKKPITLIYGPNSVGKSTVLNVFSYLKYLQIDNDIDIQEISKFGDEIDIGGIEQFIHKRDKSNIIVLEINLKNYDKEIVSFFKDSDNINIKIVYTINIQNLLMNIQYFNSDTLLATKKISYSRINNSYKKKDLNIVLEDNKFKNLIILLDDSQKKNNLQYIGPIRPNPARDADQSLEKTEEQYNSEQLWALLTENRKVLNEVNKKLPNLDMNYEIVNHKFYALQDDFDSLQDTDDNFTKYFKNYRERLEYIPKRIQSKEIQSPIEKKERLIFKDLSKDGVEVSNRDLGSGVSQVLPILSATTAHHNTTIAIEQPELHLHPKLQMELADEFIRSSKKNQNEFMIETHSEHILLRIMKRMRWTAEDNKDRDKTLDLTLDDVYLLYVDSHKGQTFKRELKLYKDGSLSSGWPNGFFEDSYNEMFS